MTAPARAPSVHVAGRGAVNSLGADHREFIEGIFAGRSGVLPLRRLAGTDCLTAVCGEVPFATGDTDLPLRLATTAAREALADWGGTPDRRMLLVLASTKADLSGITTPEGEGLGSPRRLAGRLAGALAWPGTVAAVSCACASGLSALAYAGRALRRGAATRALVVGCDSISPFILRGFSALLALSPERCRPFDRDRQGLSLGEGAGAMVLSTAAGEGSGVVLAGWGESNDANHITGPSRDGAGLALAIERALLHADTPPGHIDYVHLHGTGTPYNDGMECKALARVFEHTPPASGSKAQIGHTLGAAGVLESLIAIAALERGTAPVNLGFEAPDPDCPIELCTGPRPIERPRAALKSAAGFGGINAALVFRREEP